jgi:hypothetical protein
MRDFLAALRVRAAVLGLESAAASAGCALACPFASSTEFEAAVIHQRLAAYTRKRRLYYLFAAGAVSLLLCAFLWTG